MMIRSRRAAIVAGAVAAPVLLATVWFGYYGTKNLQGVCESAGRPLSTEEKRQKLIEYFNHHIAVNNNNPELSSYAHHLLYRYHIDRTKEDIYVFDMDPISIAPDQGHLFQIYPDIPDYARESNGTFRDYLGGIIWKPVNVWYRLTGYAYDLVFLDLTLVGRTTEGKVFSERMDYRAWINSCGEIISVPDRYNIG